MSATRRPPDEAPGTRGNWATMFIGVVTLARILMHRDTGAGRGAKHLLRGAAEPQGIDRAQASAAHHDSVRLHSDGGRCYSLRNRTVRELQRLGLNASGLPPDAGTVEQMGPDLAQYPDGDRPTRNARIGHDLGRRACHGGALRQALQFANEAAPGMGEVRQPEQLGGFLVAEQDMQEPDFGLVLRGQVQGDFKGLVGRS